MSAAKPRTPEGDREGIPPGGDLHTAFRLFVSRATPARACARSPRKRGEPGTHLLPLRNKRDMAVELLERKLDSFMRTVHAYVDWDEDPILYSRHPGEDHLLGALLPPVPGLLRGHAAGGHLLRGDPAIRGGHVPESGGSTGRTCRRPRPGSTGSTGTSSPPAWSGPWCSTGRRRGSWRIPSPTGSSSPHGDVAFLQDEAVLRECCRNSDAIVERIRAEHPELYQ